MRYNIFIKKESTMENKFITNLKMRRSIRAYTDKMPPPVSIERIIEAGTYAPNGLGRQSAIIIAVTNREIRDRMSGLNAAILGSTADPFYGAPVALMVLADRSIPTYIYDGSLVMGNMLNAAHSEGLGACWIHRAKEMFEHEEGKKLLKKLGIDGDYEGIGICIVGCPSDEELPHPRPRKPDYVYRID
jgi:nitroreductase